MAAHGSTPASAREYGPGLRAFAALISVALFLVLLEAGLRILVRVFQNEQTRTEFRIAIEALPQSERVYGLRANVPEPFVTNSYGFRGPEVPVKKPPSVFRILMLGDSITYGNAVAWNETFSHFLEQELNAAGAETRFEVLNLGVSGYNTRQELATLRQLGLQFAPDLVVLNVCLNDSDPVKEIVRSGLRNRTSIHRLSDINLRTVIASSYLLTLVKDSFVKLLRRHGTALTVLNSPTIFVDSRVRESAWTGMKGDMEEIARVTRERGIPLVALIYPYGSQINLPAEKRIPQQDLLRFFSGIGVPALDLAPLYESNGPGMFIDNHVHLSPAGHRIIAGGIRGFLSEKAVLPPVGRRPG
jgi:lysophospholipase L1-like esterase